MKLVRNKLGKKIYIRQAKSVMKEKRSTDYFVTKAESKVSDVTLVRRVRHRREGPVSARREESRMRCSVYGGQDRSALKANASFTAVQHHDGDHSELTSYNYNEPKSK